MVFLTVIFLLSCKKDNPKSEEYPLEEAYSILSKIYYWNNNITEKNKIPLLEAKTYLELFQKLRDYSPINEESQNHIDKWSFVMEKKEWDQILEGTSNDPGLGLRFINNEVRISYVQPNSNAYLSGLRRGMIVNSINNVDCKPENTNLLLKELSIANDFIFQYNSNGNNLIKNFKRSQYKSSDILLDTIYSLQNINVGYIVYNSFSNNSIMELKSSLERFHRSSIDELIIDLRYNGGGLLSSMESFANFISPTTAKGQIMYKEKHNQIYKTFNSVTYFNVDQPLFPNLKRIFFLTGNSTASASELLINILKPYLKAIIVGQVTNGKPYGMYTFNHNGYILSPVSFESFNAKDISSGYRGMEPDFVLNESIDKDFGDTKESLLNGALSIIFNDKIDKRNSIKKIQLNHLFEKQLLSGSIKRNSLIL